MECPACSARLSVRQSREAFAHAVRNPLNSATLQLEVLKRTLDRRVSNEADVVRRKVAIIEAELARLASSLQQFVCPSCRVDAG
jgi:hypothetical protein